MYKFYEETEGYDCEDCELYGECYEEEFQDDSINEEIRIIAECTEKILKTQGCGNCIFDILCDFADTFNNIGRQDMKDYMQSRMNDMD